MKEKRIDLENGFELIVWGDFKNGYDEEREIISSVGTSHDRCGINIAKKL